MPDWFPKRKILNKLCEKLALLSVTRLRKLLISTISLERRSHALPGKNIISIFCSVLKAITWCCCLEQVGQLGPHWHSDRLDAVHFWAVMPMSNNSMLQTLALKVWLHWNSAKSRVQQNLGISKSTKMCDKFVISGCPDDCGLEFRKSLLYCEFRYARVRWLRFGYILKPLIGHLYVGGSLHGSVWLGETQEGVLETIRVK